MIDLKNIFDSSILNVPRFLYDGNVINASELGNIVYGYWGKSLGFSDETLEAGVGWAIGYNSYEGSISQPYGTGALSISNSIGGSVGASIALDWSDNLIGVSVVAIEDGAIKLDTRGLTKSTNVSFGLPFKLLSVSIELNWGNSKSIWPTGITLGIGVGISVNPFPITITEKVGWTAAKHNIDESIRRNFKNWHVNGNRIANASEISLLDKNELSPFETYKLKLIMQQSSSNCYFYGCK